MHKWANVCRSCLNTAESFSYFIYENITPEMYTFCTSVEVKRDELPKSLCISCYDLLQKLSAFKKMCLQSQEKLLEFSYGLKLEQEVCLDSNELEQEVCLDSNELKHNEVTEVLVKQENLEDATHNADLFDDIDVKDEMETSMREKKTRKKKQQDLKSEKCNRQKRKFKFSCELCNKKFMFLGRFEAHKLKHEGKTATIHCKPCDKTFATWSGLHRHHGSEHSLLTFKDLTCKVCSKVCKTLLTLKVHSKIHEERKTQICDECGKGFKSALTLKNHLETHVKNRERRFTCQSCGKNYLSKKYRDKHMLRRHTDRRFICHYCSYPFADKSILIKHIMIHEGNQRLYKCELCLRTLTSQASLNVHRRIHTGEKPFLCGYCPKRFSNKGILVEHQRIHTGEKPFKCLVCEQSFTQRGSMKRHMKVHDRLCA